MIFVLGIDAATWTVIRPNLDRLPTFRRLCQIGRCRELILREKPVSPSVWCGMFCGQTPAEHGHEGFVADGNIVRRQDIKVDFIWDILHREGRRVKVLNVPFIVPAYSFGLDFKPIGFGLPTNEREWQEELDRVTERTRELMAEEPDLLISVYTLLLAGVTISIICGGLILLLTYISNPNALMTFQRWMMGGVDVAGYKELNSLLPLLLPGLFLLHRPGSPQNGLKEGQRVLKAQLR